MWPIVCHLAYSYIIGRLAYYRRGQERTSCLWRGEGGDGDDFLNLDLGTVCSNHRYGWSFVVADVTLPLLGADFLAHYRLLVDVSRGRLVDAVSFTTTPIAAALDNLALQVKYAADDFTHLCHSCPDIIIPHLCQQPQTPAKNRIYHPIKTTGPSMFSRFCRLAPDKQSKSSQSWSG